MGQSPLQGPSGWGGTGGHELRPEEAHMYLMLGAGLGTLCHLQEKWAGSKCQTRLKAAQTFTQPLGSASQPLSLRQSS